MKREWHPSYGFLTKEEFEKGFKDDTRRTRMTKRAAEFHYHFQRGLSGDKKY